MIISGGIMQKFINSGVSGLDKIIYGGIPTGNTVLIDGFPGTGKTILGMQFLYNGAMQHNETGIYITFEEFPDQIYKDMKAFGWDVRTLERQNKIRVITLSPEVLMEQIMQPKGLLEQMIDQIDCKRIVIDSISLFQYYYESKEEQRNILYSLRNTLRKFGLTSLLIKERTAIEEEEVSFTNYLVDGVINLKLQSHYNYYRKRTLEVTKMRGTRIQEGEHLYRITDQGIYLIPALSMVEDETVTITDGLVSTGLSAVDQIIGGGIHNESSFIIDTNSKANYKYIVSTILAERLKAGENLVVLLSSLVTIPDFLDTLNNYGIDVNRIIADKRIYFIEHYKRPVPANIQDMVIDVTDLNNDQYINMLNEYLAPLINKRIKNGEKWFLYYDLNTIVSIRGTSYIKRFFAEEVAQVTSMGMTILTLSNFKELGVETASFVERTSNGVIKTWVDGVYQYLQVTKSPNGQISEPLLVEKINEEPFIRLI